jgi:hypothetical protein
MATHHAVTEAGRKAEGRKSEKEKEKAIAEVFCSGGAQAHAGASLTVFSACEEARTAKP